MKVPSQSPSVFSDFPQLGLDGANFFMYFAGLQDYRSFPRAAGMRFARPAKREPRPSGLRSRRGSPKGGALSVRAIVYGAVPLAPMSRDRRAGK